MTSRATDAPKRRVRAGLIFCGLLTAACVALTVLTAQDPLHLRHFGPIFGALVAVTTIAAVVTALLLPGPLVLRVLIASICGVGGAAFTALVGFLAYVFDSNGFVDARVASPDGRYALVSVYGRSLTAIDPQYDVLLTSGEGLFARESLVWRGVEEGAVPEAMRFVGSDEIELTTDDGCGYRSKFDRFSMNVSPVWEASYSPGCARPGPLPPRVD